MEQYSHRASHQTVYLDEKRKPQVSPSWTEDIRIAPAEAIDLVSKRTMSITVILILQSP